MHWCSGQQSIESEYHVPRWYAARSCIGRPDSVVQQVASLVQRHDLGAVIPLIRLEKRSRGSFYAFLAIQSDEPGALPAQLHPLEQHPLFRNLMRTAEGHVQAFTLDEIKNMVYGEIEMKEYARRLRLSLPELPVLGDAFPAGEEPHQAAEDALLTRSQLYDRLLLWLSATGSGSRATHFAACRSLGLTDDGAEAGRILRRLRLLGHVESSRDGERWFIAPPVLTQIAAPMPHYAYVLCGQRDPRLSDALHAYAAVEESPQPHGVAPSRVLVKTDDPEGLDAVLRAGGIKTMPRRDRSSIRLAQALPPLDQWPALLDHIDLVPDLYDWSRFNGELFEPVAWQNQSGFYEYTPRERRGPHPDTQRRAIFYDAERGSFLRGDWYGLRTLAHLQEGVATPAAYDMLSAQLSLPLACRPPELYERALVLSSGLLPEQQQGWLRYADIELDLMTILTDKLHFACEETPDHA